MTIPEQTLQITGNGFAMLGIRSLPEAHAGPAFAVAAGIACFAASNQMDLRRLNPGASADGTPRNWWERLRAIWKRSA